MKGKFSLMVLLVYCVLCMVLMPVQASAYIDPSTTTFIIQAGIGLAVAIAAGVTIYYRKAKKKITKAMGREAYASGSSREADVLSSCGSEKTVFTA